MSRNITAEEFQLVYDVAFPLHPREDVALRVTMDACDYLRELERSQARRRRSARHWKADIPQEQLLQYAVYTVSYYRELDQESPRPLLEPKYIPTREDRIVRYVKHLIWRTYLLNGRSIAIGIGCLLYAYKPSEIADLLFLFEEGSLRTIKMRLAEDLRERFANDDVVSPDGKSMRTIPASDNDRLIVEGALKAFTPWGTDHFEAPTPDKLMLEMLFDKENPVSDWQRKHALIDPECAGLARLINEYNNYISSNPISQRLADPRGNLMVPDFGGGPEPSLNRFKQRLLSDSDKMFLNERRKPSGPWAYLAEVFWLLSEFPPMEYSPTDWLTPMNFRYEDGPTTIPDDAQHENHESATIGYGPYCNEIQQWYGRAPTRIFDAPASITLDCPVLVVVACGGSGQQCAASLATLVPTPLVVVPAQSGDPQRRCGTASEWIVFWHDAGADDKQNRESGFLRLIDVFQELNFLMMRRPLNRVSRPDFAFDVDIGSLVYPSGSFPNEKQATSHYGKILVFDVSWSSETSATIHARLLDLNQLHFLTRYEAGESSSGPNFFHFSGHGCESPPEPSCFIRTDYGEQGFLNNGIDGAICVWEARHDRSHTQRQRPAHEVLLKGNAQKELPNYYDTATVPFLNQSRPTQPFTFQGR